MKSAGSYGDQLLIKPLLAQVKVKHGTMVYTLQNELLSVDVSLSCLGRASSFEVTLDDSDMVYYQVFKPNDEVEIYVGRSSFTKILSGLVERVKVSKRLSRCEVTLAGCDYSQRLLQRIVKAARYGLASGGPSEVGEIVRDLLSTQTLGEPPEPITTYHVQNTGYTLQEIRFSYKPLMDCLKQLADVVRYTFYVDVDKDLHFTDRFGEYSGLTFDESSIIEVEVEDDVEYVKNRVYVLGGDEIKIDAAQEQPTQPVSLHDRYWADEFTPQAEDLLQIAIYVDKVGYPPSPLSGELRYDQNGPYGPVIRAFELSASRVASGWHIIDTSTAVTRGQKVWLILYKTGDVNNTYRWYSDGSSNKTDAYSEDGLNWVVREGSGQDFTYRTYWREPLVAVAKNQRSIDRYGVREYVESNPDIKTRVEAKVEAITLSSKLGPLKRTIRVRAEAPDQPLYAGTLVGLSIPSLGIQGYYPITQVDYRIRGYETHELEFTVVQEVE